MSEYQDEAGEYSGMLLNGYPDGEGIKFYTPDLYFEGNWSQGIKSGIGFYIFKGEKFCFEFDKGKIKKGLHENPSISVLQVLKFDENIKIDKIGGYYCEKIVKSDEATDQLLNTVEQIYELYKNSPKMGEKDEFLEAQEAFKGLSVLSNLMDTLKKNQKIEANLVNGLAEGYGKIFLFDELVYEGELRKGKRCGMGKEYSKGQLIYDGEFLNDKYDGPGTVYDGNAVITGEFRQGKPFGKAFLYDETHRYEGELKNYLPHGEGKFETKDFIYTGQFENGLMHGYGVKDIFHLKYEGIFERNKLPKKVKIFSELVEYEGEIDSRGAPHGYGIMKNFMVNATFIGEFNNFKFIQGKGIETISNGVVIEAFYSEGKRKKNFIVKYEGKIWYFNLNGVFWPLHNAKNWAEYENNQVRPVRNQRNQGIRFEGGIYYGEISDNKFNGKGKIFFDNGEVYQGDFKDSMINGTGSYKYEDGSIYCGEFKHGLKDGIGKMVFSNQTVIKGTWKQDQLEGLSKIFQPGIQIEVFWQQGKLLKNLKYFEGSQKLFGEILD